MNYIITGYDYKDDKALERRMAVREEHMKNIEAMKNEGKILYAAAMINDQDQMCGSTLFVEMTKEEVDAYLEIEAYIKGKVWETVDVTPCKIPPLFR